MTMFGEMDIEIVEASETERTPETAPKAKKRLKKRGRRRMPKRKTKRRSISPQARSVGPTILSGST